MNKPEPVELNVQEQAIDLHAPEQQAIKLVDEYVGPIGQGKSDEEKKFIALYMARRVLSVIGTMDERARSIRALKHMKGKVKRNGSW